MLKIDKHIEIVRSSIKGLSSMSEVSSDAIFEVLNKNFTRVGVTTVNNLADLENLVLAAPDLVFLGMEYIRSDSNGGEQIWLADFLDSHFIAYTGSSQKAHEFGRNKPLAKRRVLDSGLNSAAFCVIEQGQPFSRQKEQLHFPLFVKPANRGGGFGIDSDSVVNSFIELSSKVSLITNKLNSDVLIEEYLPGREFSVAILKDDFSDEFIVMPIELVAPLDENGSRLLSGAVKLSNKETVLEVSDPTIRMKVSELALAAFHALGARDYGRIDIRLSMDGTPQFLEANLIPSLIIDYGSFPKACVLNIGLDYEPMIMKIAMLGLSRNEQFISGVLDQPDADILLPIPSQVILGGV